ncbi:hypothetical protein [Nocardia sp. NPDC050412]|uniref:hypothetical protein n=1 Tax=unclassified Nocardia TaxID=2637762 RepID=UPI00378CFAD7
MAAPKPTRTLRLDHILSCATDLACTSGHSRVREEHVILAVLRDPQLRRRHAVDRFGVVSSVSA